MEDEREDTLSSSELLMGLAGVDMLNDDSTENMERKIERKVSQVIEETQSSEVPEQKKNKIKEKVEMLIEKYKSAKLVRTFDKFLFLIGLSRIIYEAFLLGRDPGSYPMYYTIVGAILVGIRFFYYRWRKWHYFLLDFCYWANLMLMVFLWVYPESEFLFISTFAFSMGPLLLAIPIFRNSMVLHSLDKLTSVFIHLAPGLVMWAIRCNPCNKWQIAQSTPSLLTYLKNAAILYMVWAVVYYFIIFKLTFERCERKNNTTLFKYHLESKKGFFYNLTGIFGEKYRRYVFMSVHMIFSLITLLITYISLYSQIVQVVFMLISIFQTFWSAANYYMEIFARNYELKLQNLEKMKRSLGGKNKSD